MFSYDNVGIFTIPYTINKLAESRPGTTHVTNILHELAYRFFANGIALNTKTIDMLSVQKLILSGNWNIDR